MAHARGRPLKFQSVVELQDKIDEYFRVTPANEVTITGLALYLDTYRSVLVDYEERDEYSATVKRAKERVQHEYEKDLRRKGRSGDIFALKNFGWKDKDEHEHYGKGGKDLFPIPIMETNNVCQNNSNKKNP